MFSCERWKRVLFSKVRFWKSCNQTWRPLSIATLGSATLFATGALPSCIACDATAERTEGVVPLSTAWTSPRIKTSGLVHPVVFIHGLDSWKGTWKSTVEELSHKGVPSLAVDLRGHGESPLGVAEEFGVAQLAADVRATVTAAGLLDTGARVVLVGHSMGGRVAMRYAADFPTDIAALVIEDMDCVPREKDVDAEKERRGKTFSRSFSTWDACREELLTYGYDAARVDGWLQDGRAVRVSSGFWSMINPRAQHLAILTVLNSTDGTRSMLRVAAARVCGPKTFPVHLLVAGDAQTACKWDTLPGGVHDMGSVCPGLSTSKYPDATHSIHNSATAAFVDLVEALAKSESVCG